MASRSQTALVLAGAVAKGAFEAGALAAAHQKGLRFSRVVGASSGSINGAYWAAAIRAGREDEAAQALPKFWLNRADFGTFNVSLSGIFSERGFSTGDKIVALLEEAVGSWFPGAHHPSSLRIVTTPLGGADGKIGEARATTYQRVLSFDDEDFDTRERRAEVFRAATASAAFPGAFVPVELPGIGDCVDGGTVNNTPIKEAITGEEIDRIVVITTHPLITALPHTQFGGFGLIGRIADILINERLFRDLKEAQKVNSRLQSLDGLRADGTLDAAQLDKVKQALGLEAARRLEIIQVRPPEELAGNPFSGFFSRKLRQAYLDAGGAAAEEVLTDLQ